MSIDPKNRKRRFLSGALTMTLLAATLLSTTLALPAHGASDLPGNGLWTTLDLLWNRIQSVWAASTGMMDPDGSPREGSAQDGDATSMMDPDGQARPSTGTPDPWGIDGGIDGGFDEQQSPAGGDATSMMDPDGAP